MDRQTNERMERWTDRQINNVWKDGKTGEEVPRQIGRYADGQMYRQTDRQTDRKTYRQTGRKADRKKERQTDRLTD
jgi:hypothetical protein